MTPATTTKPAPPPAAVRSAFGPIQESEAKLNAYLSAVRRQDKIEALWEQAVYEALRRDK